MSILEGRDLIAEICAAQGIDAADVRRVVIDLKYGDVAMLYIQMIASRKALEVMVPLAGDLDVRVLE